MPLLDAVIATNLAQPQRMLDLLARHHSDLRGLPVSVLGLAFKEDTDDVRESPTLLLIRMLVERGAVVTAYDPIATASARPLLPEAVRYAGSLQEAVNGAAAVMLVTHWAEFRTLPDLLRGSTRAPVLVDGRRLIAAVAVPVYEGIGR